MNILKIIENIFKKNKNTYHKKDIVWAKRYSSDIEEESIPLGHREGPYIIISKKRTKFNLHKTKEMCTDWHILCNF